MKHKGLWAVILCVILIIACSVAFWDTILIHTVPKILLGKSLGQTLSTLNTRFSGSPIHLLASALDTEGQQDVDFRMDTSSDLLGIIRYDMRIRTQGDPARVHAEGSVTTGGRKLDLSLFLDGSFGAVSSQELVGGNYYGITYDTFSQDIRSNRMLTFLIGSDTLQNWDTSVANLQSVMSRSYTLPNLTIEDIHSALYGIIAMKPSVETTEMTLEDRVYRIHTVSFSASGQEIAALCEGYSDKLSRELQSLIRELQEDPHASVSAVFYLLKGQIFQLRGELVRSGNRLEILADLGTEPLNGPISLRITDSSQGEQNQFTIVSKKTEGEGPYREQLSVSRDKNGIREDTELEYQWDEETGDLKVNVARHGNQYFLRMNLRPTDKGFRLQTNDFYTLLEVFTGKPSEKVAICTMDVTKGSSVNVPQYRNFTQWSAEDMLALLGGLGGLLGLKIQ